MSKARSKPSPFHPGRPVPVELFVGRMSQINHIIERGAMQVSQGKPASLFVQGEYGIGKSSIASYTQYVAEKEHSLHAIYANMSTCRQIQDVAGVLLEATARSGVLEPRRSEKIQNLLIEGLGLGVSVLGTPVDLRHLKSHAPTISSPYAMLGFLTEVLQRLQDTDVKGLFVVLDEINGIALDEHFALFVKGLIDSNSVTGGRASLPLLLMICGVQAKRQAMIDAHESVNRIFDVVQIDTMTMSEMRGFFTRAFESVNLTPTPDALSLMTKYSAGFPNVMHLVGEGTFWRRDSDDTIDVTAAARGVVYAAERVGTEHVDPQIVRALKSPDYHAILAKIGARGPDRSFMRQTLVAQLTETERKKLNNFLQKMKKLKVLRSGDTRGEYVFASPMVPLYLWMNALKDEQLDS